MASAIHGPPLQALVYLPALPLGAVILMDKTETLKTQVDKLSPSMFLINSL